MKENLLRQRSEVRRQTGDWQLPVGVCGLFPKLNFYFKISKEVNLCMKEKEAGHVEFNQSQLGSTQTLINTHTHTHTHTGTTRCTV